MADKVNPIPAGYHTITPYLIVNDGNRALEFYRQAFGAVVSHADRHPVSGRLLNAEFRIGDSMLMLGERPDSAPPAVEGLPWVSFYLYVEDADALHAQALAAGAQEVYPVSAKFYGNREGGVRDPFGNTWWLATHVEDVSPEEMERRMKQQKQG